MIHHSRKTRKLDRQGTIIIWTAISMVVLIGFLAFSIDFGNLVLTESELQNAADAGALSGARALGGGREATIEAARVWAEKNSSGVDDVKIKTDEDIELGTWDFDNATFTPIPADSTKRANAVRVTCRLAAARGNPVKLFFAPILGVENADVSAVAIAVSGGSCGGIMALNRVYLREESYTDSFNSSNADYYDAPAGKNGTVCTNGHIRLIGTAGINGSAHPGPEEDGVDMKEGVNYVTGDISVLEELIEFPPIDPGDAATVNDNDGIPLTGAGNAPLTNGAIALGGPPTKKKKKKGEVVTETVFNEDTDTLNLPPGTYYLTGLSLRKNSTLRITGPTFIYVDGDVDLSEGEIINETLKPINLQIYPMGDSFMLPNDTDLYASIYSTTSAIEKDGGAGGFFGKMVGQKIKINGSGGLHVDDSFSFGGLKSGSEQVGSPSASLVY